MQYSKQALVFAIGALLLFMGQSVVPSVAQFPEDPVYDTNAYLGFEVGAAGIAHALLSSLDKLTDNTQSADARAAVEAALLTIWDNRLEYEGEQYAAWGKTLGEDLVYPGQKYGAAGIVPVFLSFYEQTSDAVWLDRANQSYWSIMAQANNETTLPHWSYAYSLPGQDPYGIPITDLKYGAAGILSLNLQLYRQNGDAKLLTAGERIVDWLLQTNRTVSVDGINYEAIPWYDLDTPYVPIKLSFNWGISGIAPLLYEYGEVLGSTAIQDFALQMADLIVALQFDNGSWASDYNGAAIKHGFDEGVAGILHGLFRMKTLTGSTAFDQAISNGVAYLFTQQIDNSTHVGFFDTAKRQEISNNMYTGQIGILSTLIELDEFLSDAQRNLLIKEIDWLLTTQTSVVTSGSLSMLYMKSPWLNETTYDLSFSDGLAGFMYFLSMLPASYTTELTSDWSTAIGAMVNTFVENQKDNGLWAKQKLLPPSIPTSSFTNIDTNGSESVPPSENASLALIAAMMALTITPLVYKQRSNKKH